MGENTKGFLGKVGTVIAGILGIVTGFGPPLVALSGNKNGVTAVVDRVQSELQQVEGIVTTLQVVGEVQGMNGEQKLAAATPLVAQVILQSSALAGRKVEQPDLFKAGCASIADGWVKIMQSLHDKVEVTNV